MGILRFLFIINLVFVPNLLLSQDEVDYQPKMLERLLKDDFNKLEEMEISDSLKQFIPNGKFFELENENSSVKIVYVGRVNSCRAGGCSLPGAVSAGSSEYFDYFILFDNNKAVQLVKVFNYQATKGQEVTAKNWLKQFIGFRGESDLSVGKQIDGISGATVSVESITTDIKLKTDILNKL